ncbi:MAG: hypothetical protein IPK50_11000 [Fibrobacterota bacterium]|nr:hypothetical protein [Fibrobacterota bacterium]QQS07405.1 MAG: hypothetical protein IPK50_11000 [Fibrobacterota bacterium]
MIHLLLAVLIGASPDTALRHPPLVVLDSLVRDTVHSSRPPSSDKRSSFRVRDVPVAQAAALFARSQGWTLVADANLPGTCTVDLVDVSREKILEAIFSPHGLSWELRGETLKVLGGNASSRIFKIDYLRFKRGGQGSSQASISTTGSGEAGRVSLSNSDELSFWDELETQVKQIISSSGSYVSNRTAGVILVRDAPARLDEVDRFLSAVVSAATRQVELTARIYEVTLDDDHSLGVDWSSVEQRVGSLADRAISLGASTANVPSGSNWKAPSMLAKIGVDGSELTATLSALSEQGKLRAVSQPRVVTLNNQPAMVKVGTDLPFFTSTISTVGASGIQNIQEQVNVVTVGVVLSVTPSIASDGTVQLGIEPMVSTLAGTTTSRAGSTAPIVDVKQSSSIVRVRDRETVRLSGLIQETESVTERKVPILGEIPVLGALFRWQYKKSSRKELVVFITPRML